VPKKPVLFAQGVSHFAADELAAHLRPILGVNVPIVGEGEGNPNGALIYAGFRPAQDARPAELEEARYSGQG